MKKILIIADPLGKFNLLGDTTYLLMLTAKDMGFSVSYCSPADLSARNDQAFAGVRELELAHGVDLIHSTPDWFAFANSVQSVNLASFNAIFIRNDPPFNMEYYYLTQILELAERGGAKVVNHPQALRNFNEKLAILNFPELITPTLVSKNKQLILDFIHEHGTCVVKPIDLMAGRGVFRISETDPNQESILESLTDYYQQTIMVQRFIPEVVDGDKRIFIINGKIVDYCLYRIPASGQIRGNLAAGGRGEVHPLSSADYALATIVAKWLHQQKILVAGIDVIGNCLTEINITSPTGAQHILRHAGVNVTRLMLEAIAD